jgi:hypothetical protein
MSGRTIPGWLQKSGDRGFTAMCKLRHATPCMGDTPRGFAEGVGLPTYHVHRRLRACHPQTPRKKPGGRVCVIY